MYVLGIESTCDETSAAIVKDGIDIVSHTIASQAQEHSRFGGVVPELASRHHITLMLPCIQQTLDKAHLHIRDIDLIACSEGPGLIGALLVGIRTAQTISWTQNIPLVGVNHIEAHVYASLMSDPHFQTRLPALGCVLSGGHTSLILIHDIGSYSLLGQTVDDAIGEAFDKAAKMIGLGYPGGPAIEALAKEGNADYFSLKAGHVKGHPYAFSFSGLKTSVLYTLQKKISWTREELANLAASFQLAAFHDVYKKLSLALKEHPVHAIYFGGGVTANKKLHEMMKELPLPHFFPHHALCTDNSAMIAGLGYQVWKKKHQSETLTICPKTRIPFGL